MISLAERGQVTPDDQHTIHIKPLPDRSLHLQCACTLLVAVGAAYVSYRHGRDFALRFGADETTATAESIVETAMLVDKSVWGGVARART